MNVGIWATDFSDRVKECVDRSGVCNTCVRLLIHIDVYIIAVISHLMEPRDCARARVASCLYDF